MPLNLELHGRLVSAGGYRGGVVPKKKKRGGRLNLNVTKPLLTELWAPRNRGGKKETAWSTGISPLGFCFLLDTRWRAVSNTHTYQHDVLLKDVRPEDQGLRPLKLWGKKNIKNKQKPPSLLQAVLVRWFVSEKPINTKQGVIWNLRLGIIPALQGVYVCWGDSLRALGAWICA